MIQPSDQRATPSHLKLLPLALAVGVLAGGQAGAQTAPAAAAAPADKASAAPQQVVVQVKRDKAEESFKADRSDTATRSGTDLQDVPAAITMITAKVLETQQALSVQDALANTSSVRTTSSPQGRPSYAIRGLTQGSGLINGLANGSTDPGVDSVERIEVLKGPQAILAGTNLLGGVVNVVLKRPTTETVRLLSLQYGTNDDVTVAADLAGALTSDGRLSYRLNASESDARTAIGGVGYTGRSNGSLLPQLRWKDAGTDLTVGASINRRFSPVPAYTMAVLGEIRQPPTKPLSNTEDGFGGRGQGLFYRLEQSLGRDITLVSRLNKGWNSSSQQVYSPAFPIDEANAVWLFFPSKRVTTSQELVGDHYLRLQFDTGPVAHKLAVGLNHSHTTLNGSFANASGVTVDVFSPTPDNFDAVYGAPSSLDQVKGRETGVYLQDMMTFGDFNLLLGLRHNRYKQTAKGSVVGFPDFDSTVELKQNHTTPSVGMVYKLSHGLSAYASYAQGFVPTGGLDCNNNALKPTTSVNKEVGLKFETSDGRLGATLGLFDLNQNNTVIPDQLTGCSNQVTSQRNKGLEVDVQGQLATGLSAIFNYTYARYTMPEVAAQIGDAGFPRHKASLWATYDFQSAAWRGWSLGLGANATSSSEGSFYRIDRFRVPGSITVDTSVAYTQADWSLRLGVKDLFDAERYRTTQTASFVPLAPGRSLVATLRKSFH